MKEYNKSNVPKAQKLRREMTAWERKLWYLYLRKYPVRFQRQKPIGDYIIDFYCAKAQLVVELDGKYHFTGDQVNKDMERSCYLEAAGLTVFRVKNTEIDGKFKETCNKIDYLVKAGIARLESQSES